MKKILLIGAVAAIALSSCGKKHHCEEPEEVMICGTDEYDHDKDWDKDEEWDEGEKDIYISTDDEIEGKEGWDKDDKDWDDDGKKKWWWKKKDLDKEDCDPKPMDLDK